MLESLKELVYHANMKLVEENLVIFTWGNVSGIDREKGLIVIKPSGVEYSKLKATDMVVVDLDGNIVEGKYRPSSDTLTHIELYKSFPSIGGVVHTHSYWATSWAQSQRSIPPYGTTHADYFYGPIPCTRELDKNEILNNYEENTGKVIIETFKGIDENAIPGVLCSSHGPFTWGKDPQEAVHNAVLLEEISKMAFYTEKLNPNIQTLSKDILDKHYYRKHGDKSYYGQNV